MMTIRLKNQGAGEFCLGMFPIGKFLVGKTINGYKCPTEIFQLPIELPNIKLSSFVISPSFVIFPFHLHECACDKQFVSF